MAKKIKNSHSELLKCHSELVSESLENTTEIEAPYELPEGWKWVRLGDVCDTFADGDWIESKDQSDDGIRLVQTGNIGNGLFRDKEDKYHYISQETFDRLKCTEIFSGDILISRLPEPVGRSCIIPESNYKMITAVDCTIIRVNKCKTFNNWFCFYTQSPIYHDLVHSACTGTTRQRISRSNLGNIQFSLPPTLEEQKRIVTRIETLFAKLDEAKEKAQTVVDSFETRKAAILHQAFTGQLTKKWRKENGVSEDSWEETTLQEAYQINPKCIADDSKNASFIPMEKIEARSVNRFTYDIALWGKIKKNHTQFQDGDVCFAKISPCFENGKAFIAKSLENGIGAGTTELIVLRNSKIDTHFTFYIISDRSFIQGACSTYSGTVGQQRISMDYVRNYKIKVPSLPEQTEIVRILDNILEKENKSKEAAQSVLEQIDLLKKSILARAFRGEL